MIILNEALKGNSSIYRMNVASAISRRGCCFEMEKISRKNTVSHWNMFVEIVTAGIMIERSLQGSDTGEMDALMYSEQTMAYQMRLLDKASSHSPQTLNNSSWLFKKIRLRDQLGEFCLLYFVILKHTDFKPGKISDITCNTNTGSISKDGDEYSDLEI